MPLEELEQGRRHQASSLLPGVKIPVLLPTASGYWSQEKQYSPAGWNNALFKQRRESKSASVLGASLPCQQIPPSLRAAEQRAPQFLSTGDKYSGWDGQVPHDAHS